ncbi:trigger factor [Candidatus Nomurabacteria bacterium]|nr:trigger factor [Candidatus Nomurabacteria bacterium]
MGYTAEKAYTEAVSEHSLDPVSRPQIDEISEIGSDKGVKFTIKVTVKPEVELGEYSGLGITKDEPVISDEEVDKELEKVRERNARMIPVEDRAVLDGDTANIDYEGFLDGVPFDGGKGSSYDLRIGSGTFIPGFEEQVIGRNEGDEFDVNVTFPEEYHSEELKGKAVVFKVKLNSIKAKELPEIDDEFAKDVSEFDTIVEYKDSLRTKLTETALKNADIDFEEKLVKAVVAGSKVNVPDVMTENEIDRMIDEQASRMKYQGIELEQYLQYMGQDMQSFRDSLKEAALDRVRTNLVMESLGKKLAIEVSDDETDAEIARLSEQYGLKPEEIKAQFDGNLSFIKENVIFRKTIDYLKNEDSSVSDKPKTEKKPKAAKTGTKKANITTKEESIEVVEGGE